MYFNHRIEQVFVCRIPFDIESFGSCQNLQRFHLAEKSGAEYLVTSQYTTLVLPQKQQIIVCIAVARYGPVGKSWANDEQFQ